MKLVPTLTGRGAKALAAAGQKLIKVGQWSSSAIYGNPTRTRHRQRVVALQATHACTNNTVSHMLRNPKLGCCQGGGETTENKGGKVTLFSDHNRRLLRQQPKVGCFVMTAVCRSMLLCANLYKKHGSSVRSP